MGNKVSDFTSHKAVNAADYKTNPQVICEELLFRLPQGKKIDPNDVVWYSHRKLGGVYIIEAPNGTQTITVYKLEKENNEDVLVEVLSKNIVATFNGRKVVAQTDNGFIIFNLHETVFWTLNIDLTTKTLEYGKSWKQEDVKFFKFSNVNTTPSRIVGQTLIFHSDDDFVIFNSLNGSVTEYLWKDVVPKEFADSHCKFIPMDDSHALLLFDKHPQKFLLLDTDKVHTSLFTLTWPDAPKHWDPNFTTFSVRLSDDTVLLQNRHEIYLINTVLRLGTKAQGTIAMSYKSIIRESDQSAICISGLEAIRIKTVIKQVGSSTLARDMLTVFSEHWKTDVKILASEQVFNIHSAVLSVRCPKLLTLLDDNKCIDLFKYSGPTLVMMLEFIYAGTLTKLNNYTPQALVAEAKKFAQEFELLEAEKLCDKYLRKLSAASSAAPVASSNSTSYENSILLKKLLLEEKYGKAEKLAKAMIEKDPHDTKGYTYLAACLSHQGKVWEALKLSMQAYELDSHNIPIESFIASTRTAIIRSHAHLRANEMQLKLLHDSQFNAVAKAYLTLVNNQQYADLFFVINEKEYPAHLFLLKDLSYFFTNLAYMEDGSETKIDMLQFVPGITEPVMLAMLTYMYTKTEPFLRILSLHEVKLLLFAAQLFGFATLKNSCEMELIQRVDSSNAEQLNHFAVENECSLLRLACEKVLPQLANQVEELTSAYLRTQPASHAAHRIKEIAVLSGDATFTSQITSCIQLVPSSMDRSGALILGRKLSLQKCFALSFDLQFHSFNPRFPMKEAAITLRVTPKDLPWQDEGAPGNLLLKIYPSRSEEDPQKCRFSFFMQSSHACCDVTVPEPTNEMFIELVSLYEADGSLVIVSFLTINKKYKFVNAMRVAAADVKKVIAEMSKLPYFVMLQAKTFRNYSSVLVHDFNLHFFDTIDKNYATYITKWKESTKNDATAVKFSDNFWTK